MAAGGGHRSHHSLDGQARPARGSYYILSVSPSESLHASAMAAGWDRCHGCSPATRRAPSPPPLVDTRHLVHASVVREDMAGPSPVPPVPAPVATALPPPLHLYVLFPHSNVFAPMVPPLSLGNGLMTGAIVQGGGGSAMVVSPVRLITSDGFGKIEGRDLSSLSSSPLPYVFNGGLTGRKVAVMEKVVERRQRRMIKNRESTSRLRQRKQET